MTEHPAKLPASFPKDKLPESSIPLKRDGYLFVSKRCERFETDAFEARIMLYPTVCARGADAAEMFYAEDRFTRVDAMPRSVAKLLQDDDSVGSLDTDQHRHRKAMFTGMMTPDALGRLKDIADERWTAFEAQWKQKDGPFVLTDEVRLMLAEVACTWAGIPQTADELKSRRREFGAMLDATGSVGPANWHAQRIRVESETWAEKVFADYRASPAMDDPNGEPTALKAIAEHRDHEGELLPPGVCAVEIINILRPTMAVDRYVIYAALMLEKHPEWRARLIAEPEIRRPFAQEIRRLAPFFPVIMGRARKDFDWNGRPYKTGDAVMLDLYSTNLDPKVYDEPHSFDPDRFAPGGKNEEIDPFAFVPSGGGDPTKGHRCPGEEVTIIVTMVGAERLARMAYKVPEQDLSIDLTEVPARPKSGFVIEMG